MLIEESNLTFNFNNQTQAIKFDDTDFYRKSFNKMPSSKGVDILANSKDVIQLIEIKNCSGHEIENMWRTSINNSNIKAAPHGLDVEDRDSLDIEMVKKVVYTITCLYGAWTKSERGGSATELTDYWQGATEQKIKTDKKQLLITLFLEGNFSTKSRNKKAIMHRLQESINTKLSWLNCKVMVVDSDTYKGKYFRVS